MVSQLRLHSLLWSKIQEVSRWLWRRMAGWNSFEGTESRRCRRQVSIYSVIVAYPTPASIRMVRICFLNHHFLLFEWRKLFFHITHRVGERSVCADGPFSGNSLSAGIRFYHPRWKLYLYASSLHCIFTRHYSKPEMPATLTLLAHCLCALSSLAGLGHEASKFTIDSYITKWRVHTGKQLRLLPLKPQAPKTSGAIPALLYKTIPIWQRRLRFVFTDVSGELVKMQDTVESDPGNRQTFGCKRIIPTQTTILLLRAYSEPHTSK